MVMRWVSVLEDLTNDGYPEILVTGYLKTQLFLNLAGQGFRDITTESGLDNPEWGSSMQHAGLQSGWLARHRGCQLH